MGYLLAVDGGGTKTEFRLCSLKGEFVTSVITGASNYKGVGEEKAFESLREGFDIILQEAQMMKEDINYSVWGISGCDSERDFDVVRRMVRRLGIPYHRYEVCNDAVMGYYAQTDGPGMVVVAGTGSIVWGIDRDGICCRKGGWGHLLSDGGSGYWIGSEALRRTILYCEECYPYSPMFSSIREHFQVETFAELPSVLTEIMDPYRIASVARIVVQLSQEDNAEAKKILEEGAALLTDMVEVLYRMQNFEKENMVNIVLSGGVLKSKEYINILKKEIERREFQSNVKYIEQINAPVQGGIRLAKKRIVET